METEPVRISKDIMKELRKYIVQNETDGKVYGKIGKTIERAVREYLDKVSKTKEEVKIETEVIETEVIGTSKVTRGGQMTLSRKVLNELGVEIGDYVIFEKIEGNKLSILPAKIKKK